MRATLVIPTTADDRAAGPDPQPCCARCSIANQESAATRGAPELPCDRALRCRAASGPRASATARWLGRRDDVQVPETRGWFLPGGAHLSCTAPIPGAAATQSRPPAAATPDRTAARLRERRRLHPAALRGDRQLCLRVADSVWVDRSWSISYLVSNIE